MPHSALSPCFHVVDPILLPALAQAEIAEFVVNFQQPFNIADEGPSIEAEVFAALGWWQQVTAAASLVASQPILDMEPTLHQSLLKVPLSPCREPGHWQGFKMWDQELRTSALTCTLIRTHATLHIQPCTPRCPRPCSPVLTLDAATAECGRRHCNARGTNQRYRRQRGAAGVLPDQALAACGSFYHTLYMCVLPLQL